MKTANLLSVTAFLALAGLMTSVGCSTPAVGEIGDDSAAETEGDDDDDTVPAKKKTTTSSADDDDDVPASNTASDDDDDTTTTPPAGGDDCDSCLSANAKAVAFDQCAMDCQDDACADECFQTSGCEADQACGSTLDQCETVCDAAGDDDDTATDDDDDVGADGDECFSCLGSSPAAEYIECSDQCQDEQCDDECFDNACGGNEDACESKLDSCEDQCFGGE